nr:hypothetical protein [Cytophagales bacterium]
MLSRNPLKAISKGLLKNVLKTNYSSDLGNNFTQPPSSLPKTPGQYRRFPNNTLEETTDNDSYGNANRLPANYTVSGEGRWFTVNGLLYDANGNGTKVIRRNQMTGSTYGEADKLT